MAPLRQRRYDMFGLVFPSVTFGEVKALDQSHTAWKLKWETQKKKNITAQFNNVHISFLT